MEYLAHEQDSYQQGNAGCDGLPLRGRGTSLLSTQRPTPGDHVIDFELPDHHGNRRRLSELVGGDPAILQFYRGFWCPKDQAHFRGLVQLQDQVEVAYTRMISVSVDPPEVEAAFRAGVGARWTFLSDASRELQDRRAMDVPLRRVEGTTAATWAARDHGHRPSSLHPDRPHALSQFENPQRVQRLLVLGPPNQCRTGC